MSLFAQLSDEWQLLLQNVRADVEQIEKVISQDCAQGQRIIPREEDIFRALKIPPNAIRVVIMGQDPYPNPLHACGLSFSVPSGTNPMPPTLRNILQEVQADIGSVKVQDGDLSPWTEQGVLLLNRVLTVVAHKSDSHRKIGWQTITERILEATVQSNPNVIAILWGNQALEVRQLFKPENVIVSAHPSPLSAYRGFTGSKPFSQVNQNLVNRGEVPIIW